MPYEAHPSRTIGKSYWYVREAGSPDRDAVRFGGEHAEALAREYAEWKNGQPEPESDWKRRNRIDKAAREFSRTEDERGNAQ